jgi:hypothetical protein
MPWQATLADNSAFVELIYSGNVGPKELQEALAAAADLSRRSKAALFLADCSSMIGGHSLMDLFHLISTFPENGINRLHKEAILLPENESAMENVRFFEVACQNRGFNVRSFRTRRDALAWLRTEHSLS